MLRYEDLIMKPAETLASVLKYLGLSCTSSQIEEMIQRASQDTAELQGHRTSKDVKSSIGRWHHDLDLAKQALCQEVFGDLLQKFGYTL